MNRIEELLSEESREYMTKGEAFRRAFPDLFGILCSVFFFLLALMAYLGAEDAWLRDSPPIVSVLLVGSMLISAAIAFVLAFKDMELSVWRFRRTAKGRELLEEGDRLDECREDLVAFHGGISVVASNLSIEPDNPRLQLWHAPPVRTGTPVMELFECQMNRYCIDAKELTEAQQTWMNFDEMMRAAFPS